MIQECSNHHPSLSTLSSKGLSRSRMKCWAIYTHLLTNAIVRLPHHGSGDSQGQETFLAPSADKETRKYDTRVLKPPSALSILRSNGLSRSRMNWWAIYINLSVNAIVKLLHPRRGDIEGVEPLLAPSADKQTCNYYARLLKPPFLPINTKVKGIEL